MREKLSIQNFKNIKMRLQELFSQIDQKKLSILNPVVSKYVALEEKLVSYDLSNIPFGTWKGLIIVNPKEYQIDFSKTNAKLNFKYIKVIGNANYRNCQTKNIKYLGKNLNETSFDYHTVIKNYKVFLSFEIPYEIRNKFYNNKLTFSDLANLSSKQREEIVSKNMYLHLDSSSYSEALFKTIGLNKYMLLYKITIERADFRGKNYKLFTKINKLFDAIYNNSTNNKEYKDFIKTIKDSKVDLLGEICFKYYKENILDNSNNKTDIFINYSPIILEIKNILGYEKFKELFEKHTDFFYYLLDNDAFSEFLTCLNSLENKDFTAAVKKYYLDYCYKKGSLLPPWLKSLGFTIVHNYYSWEEMKDYNELVILESETQNLFINNFGFENIKRFEKETSFFSNEISNIFYTENELNYKILYDFFSDYKNTLLVNWNSVTYDEFMNLFAKFLVFLKTKSYHLNYDFIEGTFRDKYPEIFIAKDAPQELRDKFYDDFLDADFLCQNKNQNYIPYLLDKNLSSIFKSIKYDVYIIDSKTNRKNIVNFIEYFSNRFGNEAMLRLLEKYGDASKCISLTEIKDTYNKNEIEDILKKNIYNEIIKSIGIFNYKHLIEAEDFVKEYPDIFIDLSAITTMSEIEKEHIITLYYDRSLKYDNIKKYPELIDILKEKQIDFWFDMGEKIRTAVLIKTIGKENFLELCKIYGTYVVLITDTNSLTKINNYKNNSKYYMLEVKQYLKKIITNKCLNGECLYNDENAPEFLKKEHPELFLSEDAPRELKDLFYKKHTVGLTFEDIKYNKNWLSYLNNKNIIHALLKNTSTRKAEIKKYFKLFGDKALTLGVKRPDAVNKMIEERQVELMKAWYDKTGWKFIPDYIIMKDFSIEEANYFFNSINHWNKFIKLEEYSDIPESREAMLKLAYSFGVFHNDAAGFQKTYELLTNIPHYINEEQAKNLRGLLTIIPNKKQEFIMKIYELKDSLISEGLKIEDDNIFNYIYRKNNNQLNNLAIDNKAYTLAIDPQRFPKSTKLIRYFMSFDILTITPTSVHQFFGGFKMEYNKDFREFLLNNFDELCNNPDNSTYIGSIQRQFKQIKAMNSNRVLTVDLAISFVQQNKYENVNPGNEKVAEISAIAGYDQEDFVTLQQIYNYGKSRTFSSIPRIEGQKNDYFYEILRLDDPLALAIGTLTDCCQEIGNAGETCMEHSMIDNNGRIFVIKDHDGNIVSQSWVWRNKDVLCFDNIEIPFRAFKRAESDNKDFAKEIYNIYTEAAKKLIEQDEKVYNELLTKKIITQEQYDGLRLGKVTVGLGYNDIADALKTNAQLDKGKISHPLPSESIVLDSHLYVSDSSTQYILEERENRIKYNGPTLAIHNDTYKIYDSSNFTKSELKMLIALEYECKNYNSLFIDSEESNIFLEVANNYDLNPDNTKIILHPNFAIIYEDKENEIIIDDLFFNTKIDNLNQQIDITDKVLIQVYFALNQINNNKKLNTNKLDNSQIKFIEQAINIQENDLISLNIKR